MADWFRNRTYDTSDFSPDSLSARKEELGIRVSVVLPARNEADTIQGMVKACAALDRLVDEVVVMDGGSTDATVDRALAAGAQVHHDSQVMPEHGPPLGKGDALWRSLAVTTGDVVVFVDSDIRNPDPRFVWALLGPLLVDPKIALVKGFYDRPIEVGRVLEPTGGGRVTELCARPLINLFWPELAGIIQPLSGEYAGRRSLLEAVPFFTGYGVEFGLLVDTLEHCGIDAIAQVDLTERIHRNQPIQALSRMAFGIMHVAMRRLAQSGRARFADGLPERYVQFSRVDAHPAPQERLLAVAERPPLSSLRH